MPKYFMRRYIYLGNLSVKLKEKKNSDNISQVYGPHLS